MHKIKPSTVNSTLGLLSLMFVLCSHQTSAYSADVAKGKPTTLANALLLEITPSSAMEGAAPSKPTISNSMLEQPKRVLAIYGSDGLLRTDLQVGSDRFNGLRTKDVLSNGLVVQSIVGKCVGVFQSQSSGSVAALNPKASIKKMKGTIQSVDGVTNTAKRSVETLCWTGIEPAIQSPSALPSNAANRPTPGNLRSNEGLPAGVPLLPVAQTPSQR
jgi:hypothetical protein